VCRIFSYGNKFADQGGGRILLGDSTGGGAVMLRPSKCQCAGVWISAGLSCVYVYLNICTVSCDLGKIRLAPDVQNVV
jgi:hypothetical protein